jgi:hypothetical protein
MRLRLIHPARHSVQTRLSSITRGTRIYRSPAPVFRVPHSGAYSIGSLSKSDLFTQPARSSSPFMKRL